MNSFVDEYIKIAASVAAAKNQKTRIGRRPIRAHNLLKKADAKAEVLRAASGTVGGLKGLLGRLWAKRKPIGMVGGGALGMKGAEEFLLEPLDYAYRAKAMGAQY
jgi:hypothetical protein